jgi:DinB family protein
MDQKEREQLIAQYRDGYSTIAEALLKITKEELDGRPGPGRWSVREIVHHLADSEMTAAVRLRRLLAEEHPEIKGYDQDEFARRLHYDRPHETSLELFKYVRDSTAELLERMVPADWLREGTHSEMGRYTTETWLTVYAGHAHKHALQIRAARDAARKQELQKTSG